CHAIVSEESTLCWNCNSNLVEEKSSSSASRSYGGSVLNPYAAYDEEEKPRVSYTPRVKQKKSPMPIIFAVIVVIAGIFAYTCIAGKKSGGTSSSISSSDLSRYVSLSLSNVQLQITTTKTLHNVRIRMNDREYNYEVNLLSAGVYTVGLGAFSDKKGNRFNPYSKKVRDIAIYSDEGSAHFAPN
ncbi:MAG: hypothetical protein II563_09310, partial [Treponema sp.]|nr:hypothetical protein [Treponema sp.]